MKPTPTCQRPLSERLFLLAVFSIPFLALSPLMPLWGIPTGVMFGVLVLLCLVALIREIGVKPSLSSQWQSPLLTILWLFLLVNLISLANAGIERGLGKENYIHFAYLAFSILVFWVTTVFAGKIETLTRIIQVYLLASTISVIWSLCVTIGFMAGVDTGQPITWTVPRVFGTSLEPQVYGNFLLSVLPLVTALIIFERHIGRINRLIALHTLLFLAIIMTFSLGAWVGLLGSWGALLCGIKYFSARGVAYCVCSVFVALALLTLIHIFLFPGYGEGFKSNIVKSGIPSETVERILPTQSKTVTSAPLPLTPKRSMIPVCGQLQRERAFVQQLGICSGVTHCWGLV